MECYLWCKSHICQSSVLKDKSAACKSWFKKWNTVVSPQVGLIMIQSALQVKTAQGGLVNSCVKGWLIISLLEVITAVILSSAVTMMKMKPPCHSARTVVIELSNIINILITQITPVSSFSVYLCLFMTHFDHLTNSTIEILPPRVLWLTVVINMLNKWCFHGYHCGLLEPTYSVWH